MPLRVLAASLSVWFMLAGHASAQAKFERTPILFDFDIGEDIDDTFALATVLASPELDLRGVTTVGHDPYKRAQMACRFLTAVGRREIPVAAGEQGKPTKPLASWQVQYGNHASVYFRDPKPAKARAPEFLYEKLKAEPGRLTVLAVGPLTNIAKLFTDYPDSKKMIKRLVIMGGSARRGYSDGSKPQAEYNIAADVKAAQIVFSAGVPLVVAPLDATAMVRLDAKRQKRLFDRGSLLTLSVQALTQLWRDKNDPILYDPVAVALVYTEKFCTMEEMCLQVDDKGFTRISEDGRPNARVAVGIKTDAFLDWLVDRIAKTQAPAWPTMRVVNESKLVPRGNMPGRVHVFEDFETDIEKRWWLSGRIHQPGAPATGRALRGVLTQDFDDRQGETKTLYTAVVFNPVPGPPMGKNTQLSFRYWLKGTDTLRVQLYSLSRGYHRCLMLKGLPQGKWQEGNVDMTQMRKPDGTGGPLSESERIDDIQFYADPRAELLIDDIVLYDAAEKGETRPFPKRFLFTGWFDSGKQGKEWPGKFEIAPKLGFFWHAAKSIPHPNVKGQAWINIGLRGNRPLGAATHLSFRYKLVGTDSLRISMPVVQAAKVGTKGKGIAPVRVELNGLKTNEWASLTVDLNAAAPNALTVGSFVSEIGFFVPAGGQLLLDDLLLYEPRQK
ncbi:MAG: nucleoside hydrolase [Planctomycetes bacterium]|nr:nucleoside hydrolase [Planctomycetota bacterium]